MNKPKEKLLPPAYVPYKTFDALIKGFRETGVPSQIDRSVLHKMSGSGQSAMLASLRFLDLIDANFKTTPKLQQLVESTEENYSTQLKDVLEDAYHFLFRSSLDLSSATTNQVSDAFKAQGIGGSTITKAIAFFLTAAKTAGIKISSHVKPPQTPKSANGKKKKKQATQKDPGIKHHQEENQAMGQGPATTWHEMLVQKFPDFDPSWDVETQKKWFEAFSELMKKGDE